MSEKTQSLYRELSKLDGLCERLRNYAEEKGDRTIDDIQFEMSHSLELLRMWTDSLYRFNGKSRSRAKQSASRSNGKKGGRPPKEITLARQRLVELENEIEGLERSYETDLGEQAERGEKLLLLKTECQTLEEKIAAWQKERERQLKEQEENIQDAYIIEENFTENSGGVGQH